MTIQFVTRYLFLGFYIQVLEIILFIIELYEVLIVQKPVNCFDSLLTIHYVMYMHAFFWVIFFCQIELGNGKFPEDGINQQTFIFWIPNVTSLPFWIRYQLSPFILPFNCSHLSFPRLIFYHIYIPTQGISKTLYLLFHFLKIQ